MLTCSTVSENGGDRELSVPGPPPARRAEAWGYEVVDGIVEGHPCRVYYRRPRSAPELLLDARRWGTRPYLVQGSRRISFAQHEEAVCRVTRYLQAHGLAPGGRVLLFGANQPEWVVAFWATLVAGAVVVPANLWWSEAELRHALHLTSPTIVLADADHREVLPPDTVVIPFEDLRPMTAGGDEAALLRISPDSLGEAAAAVILFTSGTTGLPKGAVLSHRSLVANVQNRLVAGGRLPPDGPDGPDGPRVLVSAPLFHMGGVQTALLSLASGATMVFLEGRFDAGEVLRLIEEERITRWGCVPTMAFRVLEHPDLLHRDRSSVRSLSLAGSPVPPELCKRLQEAFPTAAAAIGTGYGLTESGGTVTAGAGEEIVGQPGCVGRPMRTVELRIDHPDACGVGEVLVRSPAVMSGYWGSTDDPALDADGWLHTGDVGQLGADGRLRIIDRLKDVIIRGGENIASPHVEDRLLQYPGVAEVAVIGLPHSDLGEEVAAVIVPRAGEVIHADELQTHAALALAYFEVPTRWWIRSEPLPLNLVGKVLKRELRESWPTSSAN